MKDFIVLIATIILGLAIAVIVLSFRGKATTLGNSASSQLDNLANNMPTVPTT